jgi:hypothetical protein
MAVRPAIEGSQILLIFIETHAAWAGSTLADEHNIAAASWRDSSNTSFGPLVLAKHKYWN